MAAVVLGGNRSADNLARHLAPRQTPFRLHTAAATGTVRVVPRGYKFGSVMEAWRNLPGNVPRPWWLGRFCTFYPRTHQFAVRTAAGKVITAHPGDWILSAGDVAWVFNDQEMWIKCRLTTLPVARDNS